MNNILRTLSMFERPAIIINKNESAFSIIVRVICILEEMGSKDNVNNFIRETTRFDFNSLRKKDFATSDYDDLLKTIQKYIDIV